MFGKIWLNARQLRKRGPVRANEFSLRGATGTQRRVLFQTQNGVVDARKVRVAFDIGVINNQLNLGNHHPTKATDGWLDATFEIVSTLFELGIEFLL